MAASSLRSDRTGLPPYVSPMLETLGRMQSRAPMRPGPLTERATALLAERFGAAPAPTEAAFAHGAPGLLAGHTNYFDGFAVLTALPQGAAVAVRAAPASRLVFDGDDAVWTFDATAPPPPGRPAWVALVEAAVRQLGEGAAVEVAVVCTVPAGCLDAYLAALAVAVARALQALWALPDAPETLLKTLHRAAAEALGAPFSLAYLIGAEVGRPGRFTLVDTDTGEHLPLDAPPPEEVGWALVDAGSGYRLDPAQDYQRSAQAHKALEGLRQRGFEQLGSIRDLEHRDLERALAVLPRSLRPVVRHLVSENRRVQKLVVAVRRRDWQLFGALLLMSHASLRADWRGSDDAAADLVVEQAEAMSIEGMHGATVTGRGGCVLLVGQPFVVPLCLDRVRAAVEERFGRTPEMVLL